MASSRAWEAGEGHSSQRVHNEQRRRLSRQVFVMQCEDLCSEPQSTRNMLIYVTCNIGHVPILTWVIKTRESLDAPGPDRLSIYMVVGDPVSNKVEGEDQDPRFPLTSTYISTCTHMHKHHHTVLKL